MNKSAKARTVIKESLNDEEVRLNKQIADGTPTKASSDLVAQWVNDGEEWLDELPELTSRMPGTDRAYLKELRAQPKSGAAGFASFNLKGFAREEKDTLNLNERFLATDDRYLGLPVTERAETKTEYYKAYFEKEIRLLPPGKTGKAKKGAAPAPTAENKPARASAGTDATPSGRSAS